MEWLDRLDDALEDAAHTSQRIQNRRHQRNTEETTTTHNVNTPSLSELVTHLRPKEQLMAKKQVHPPSIYVQSRDLRPSKQYTAPSSRGLNNRHQQSALRKETHRQPNHEAAIESDLLGMCSLVNQNLESDSSPRLSKSSPWGKALDSILTEDNQQEQSANKVSYNSPSKSLASIETRTMKKFYSYSFEDINLDDETGKPSLADGKVRIQSNAQTVKADDDEDSQVDDKESVLSHPQHVVLKSDFYVDQALATWRDDGVPYDPTMNCFGVVHVRVLRAQRLSCPVGSLVHSVVALPPWKGKVRTTKTKAFSGTDANVNVCADWSDIENSSVSMVNAYSSDDSPVPLIRIVMVFSASALGMLEFEMCFIELPCTALLKKPVVPISGWFETTRSSNEQHQHETGEHWQNPLIQIEAVFEPEDKAVRKAPHRNHLNQSLDLKAKPGEDDSSVVADVSLRPTTVNDPGEVQHQDVSDMVEIQPKELQPTGQDDRSQSDFSASLNSFRHEDAVVSSSKTHLLRLKTFYFLARCAVCSRSIMSGFTKARAYRCETCGIDCCSDCRLQVDFRLPCGSKAARTAVEHSVQSKLTTENILRIVAPIAESDGCDPVNGTKQTVAREISTRPDDCGFAGARGIGTLKTCILRAVILETPLPSKSDPADILNSQDVKKGDYYFRITSSNGDSVRTKTVQESGRPRFASDEMSLIVPHYGVDFSLELVDESTDMVVGASIIPANSILQAQRDLVASASIVPFIWAFNGPVTFNKARRVVVELRNTKTQHAASFFSDSTSGSVVGTVELDILLAEDRDALYGKDPYQCPPRAPDQFDLAIFQSHIARISGLIRDFKKLVEVYKYLVGWENPTTTGGCALIYLQLCFSFNPEYIGAMPLFVMLALMVYLGFDRAQGRFPRRFINRELDKIHERDSSGTKVHKPIGMVKVQIMKGLNLKYPEFGFPGSASCRVFLDLTRFLSADDRKSAVSADKAMSALHELCCTESIYSSDPTWQYPTESVESRRLRQLFPSDGSFFEYGHGTNPIFAFPILQPGRHDGQAFVLEPWSTSSSAIVFEVRFSDLVSIVPGTERVLGEVVVPVSKLISDGEMRGWFKVHETGKHDKETPRHGKILRDGSPQLQIQLTWVPPEELFGSSPDREREASAFVQEEMVRAAVLSCQQNINLLGSSIGAFNTVRGLSTTLRSVQNVLGALLDAAESFLNIFNFSDPYKSTVFFSATLLLWVVLSTIPTRWLMGLAGVVQFGVTLRGRLLTPGKSQLNIDEMNRSEGQNSTNSKSCFGTWISNAFRGLPSDEDLRRTYYWETRRVVASEVDARSREKRNNRLTNLWTASWHGEIELVRRGYKRRRRVFGMIQGNRFLWWDSTECFDRGDTVLGQLLLQGHAGVASPSPVEMKEVGDEQLDRMIVIFGRGVSSQERISLFFGESVGRESFEASVLKALARKYD